MFTIKICGVRLKEDIEAVAVAGADAVGLNFFPPSIRYLNPDQTDAVKLSELARQRGLAKVGVFVNESAARMLEVQERLGLDAIQLHGDEATSIAAELIDTGASVVRAIKLPTGPLSSEEIHSNTDPWDQLGCHLLLDAHAGSAHGGSGRKLDWQSIGQWASRRQNHGWTLAGGLHQDNIVQAITASHARSVDTASGVECPRGVKNPGRITAFCHAARTRFGMVGNEDEHSTNS